MSDSDNPKARPPRRRGPLKLVPVLASVLVLVPLFLHLAFLPSLGPLQNDDYYGVIHRLSDGHQLVSDLGTWLQVRITYHRVTVPALIWALNLEFFHGNNYPMAVLALGFLIGVFLILERHLPERPGDRSPEGWLAAAAISVLVFAPHAVYNLALSFGGIHYYLSDLLAMLSIAVVVHCTGWRLGPWPLVFLGLAASFTFSSHLALWPALMIGALVLGRRVRDFAVIALAAAVAGAVFLWGTHLLSRSSGSWPGLELILRYVGVFLGSPFTKDPEIARTLGWIGLGLSAVLQPWVYFRLPALRPATAFWLMVQLYGLGNGLLAAMARAPKYGETQAVAARYQLFVALFWAATLVTATLLIRHILARRRPLAIAAGLLAATAITVSVYARGSRAMSFFAHRGDRQEVTALGFLWSAWDQDLVAKTACHQPARLIGMIELLRSLGHVPFDRPVPEMSHQRVPKRLLSTRPHPEIDGHLTEVRSTSNPDLLRVRGWAFHPRQATEEIVFIDRRRRRMSRILLGFHRVDLRARVGRRAVGWEGFVEWRRRRDVWTPYIRLASDPTFYPLPTSSKAEKHLGEIFAQRLEPAGL